MINVSNLTKYYGKKCVFDDLSLTLSTHAWHHLDGASGLGKTTLLRILAGIEGYDSGTITGLETSRVSMVFQENHLVESLSVWSNIVLPHLPAIPPDFQKTLAAHLLAVGLDMPLDTPIHTLSGGMKRRVALLRALCVPADVLLLDEPFTGLDYATKCQVIAFLKQHTQNKTVIIATHAQEDYALLPIAHTLTLPPSTIDA